MASSSAIGSSTYPGKPAQFELDGKLEDWKIDSKYINYPEKTALKCRGLKFKSITPDSSIEGFQLLGYLDGSIRISAEFNKKVAKEFQAFLKSLGYKKEHNFDSFDDYTIAHEHEDKKILFKVLTEKNEIVDKKALEKVKKVVEKGCFTPFQGVIKEIREVYDQIPSSIEMLILWDQIAKKQQKKLPTPEIDLTR